MRVIAVEMGFYKGSRRRPGDEFEMDDADLQPNGVLRFPSWVYPASPGARREVEQTKNAREEKLVAGAIASSGGAHGAKDKAASFAEAVNRMHVGKKLNMSGGGVEQQTSSASQERQAMGNNAGPEPFSYPNSDHRAEGAHSSARTPDPGGPRPFSYSRSNHRAEDAPSRVDNAEDVRMPVPDAIRELRARDSDRRVFSAQANYRDAGLDEAADGSGTSPEHKAVVAEMKEIFADLRLSAREARDFVSLFKTSVENPPDEATQEQWQATAYRQLVARYGERGANDALDLARQFVQRDPRVLSLLEKSRLGNHPQVIEKLVHTAMQERVKGRI